MVCVDFGLDPCASHVGAGFDRFHRLLHCRVRGNNQSLPAAVRGLIGDLQFAVAPGHRAPVRRISCAVRRFFKTGFWSR